MFYAMMIPDRQIGWYPFAVKRKKEFSNEYNLIISSSTPVTSHLIAHAISKQNNIFWIADFRDLWTQNHYVKYSLFRYLIENILERKVIKQASYITTVSNELKNDLVNKYPFIQDKIKVIMNGFDPEDFLNGNDKNSKNFTITYTGGLYNFSRNPVPFLESISELITENKIDFNRFKIIFAGPYEKKLHEAINMYKLNNIFTDKGLLSNKESIKLQSQSNLLLLLGTNHVKEKGVLTGKIFEYLGSKRLILAFWPQGGAVEKLIAETNSGIVCKNKNELKANIEKEYNNFLNNVNTFNPDVDVIRKYTRDAQNSKFIEIIKEIRK